jgi:hypothetical protein
MSERENDSARQEWASAAGLQHRKQHTLWKHQR